ncbi:MAG TPA: RNA methyltransferase [Methylomirabilota bacterium]|nr:RNA methyltransferase [Methylomirabilota bacterium]
MFHLQPIQTLDLPELAPYRTMRMGAGHVSQRLFVAEGEKILRRLLESTLGVVSCLMPAKWVPEFAPLLNARPEDIPVYLAEKKLLETLVGFSMYQGVLGVGRIPPATTLEALLAATHPPRLLAAVDGLTNAENLGVLVRNCAAFGVQGLLVGETCSHPYLRRSVRNSMGTIFKLPLVEPPSLAATLRELSSRGTRVIAAHPHAEQKTPPAAVFAGDCCIVFGSEGLGLSPAVLAVCDEAVAIPMHPGVDSLNVGSASAVFLYEAARQRGFAGGVIVPG